MVLGRWSCFHPHVNSSNVGTFVDDEPELLRRDAL